MKFNIIRKTNIGTNYIKRVFSLLNNKQGHEIRFVKE